MSFKRRGSGTEKPLPPPEEQQAKINEVRKLIGSIVGKFPSLCSDASLARYLRARSWNSKKAAKMLKETLKWRLEYKPENIRWDDVVHEAETGKVYRSNYLDKHGRAVLVMRPGFQNSTSARMQMKYLIYCMESTIINMTPDQEQMVWLIDFQGWNMSSISVKVTRETAHVLQNRYPETLGLAILYNPPKIFESFWMMVKPFLEHKTSRKVRFVYSGDPESQKIMESIFDMDKLESAFGGRNSVGFDFKEYSERMREEDKKVADFISSGSSSFSDQSSIVSFLQQPESLSSDHNSEISDAVSTSSEGGSPCAEACKDSEDENTISRIDSKQGVVSESKECVEVESKECVEVESNEGVEAGSKKCVEAVSKECVEVESNEGVEVESKKCVEAESESKESVEAESESKESVEAESKEGGEAVLEVQTDVTRTKESAEDI